MIYSIVERLDERCWNMLDLSLVSGLPISLGDDMKLVFDSPLEGEEPAVMTTVDMAELWFQPDKLEKHEIYYVYRDVRLPENEELIRSRNLRYDITVVRPGMVGHEFFKTAGHYYPMKPGTRVTYTEAYEVLSGRAHYLLQKADPGSGDITDAVLMEAEPGDHVLIPHGYGRIAINPEDEPLVMASWVAVNASSECGMIKRYRGGAYFEIAETSGAARLIPNKRHEGVAPLRSLEPRDFSTFALLTGNPMYQSFLESPDRFRWLTEPEDFVDELEFIMGD